MTRLIAIEAQGLSADALRGALERDIADSEVGLRVERTRSLDAAIVVAIVGASGTAMAAFIAGILKFAVQRGAQRVVIHGKSGRTIEFPADLSKERRDELVQLAKDLDVERIVL